MEDITKTGPVGLKGLKGLNQSPSASSQYFQNLQRMSAQQLSTVYLPEAQENVGVQLGQAGYGDSTYDEAATRLTQVEDLNELRAQEQPWYSQVVNGLAKGVVLALTTFLDGTVGLLVGAGQGIANLADDDPNTGFWSGLWDNDFSKAMQKTNENFEQWLPNYYTQDEKNSPWYENIFTANFLGDKFIKNLGFSVGAIYSGGVWSKALKATKLPEIIGAVSKSSEMPAMVTSTVGATISAVNEGRIEALNNSKDWFEYQKAQLDDEFQQRTNAALEEYEATKGSLVGNMETGFHDPAYAKYKATLEKEQAAYNAALGKLSEDRIKMGNVDLLLNIPILATSNYLQFAKFYANGFKTARRTANIAGRAGEYTVGSTKRGTAWAATKGALVEGTEEISQKAASEISGTYYATDVNNFYKARTDRGAEQETLSWAKAFSQGINKTINDGSSWEEFFIGSLTGALGIPTFRSVKAADGSFQSPVVMEGGIYNHLREYSERRSREQEIVDYMNSRVQSPEFLNYYQGLIRHNKYQRDMDQAVENNDEFNFKNAEHAQFVSDIVMFDNAGKLEDLVTLINSAYDTSDTNLQSIVENTTSTTEDGKKIGPFIDANGNPMYATPEGKREMIEKLTQNKESMSKAIDTYVKAKNSIDISTGQQLSDSQLEELAWMKSQLSNWSDRAVTMSGEVKQVIGKVIENLNSFRRFQDAIRTEEEQNHAELTDRYNRADKNVRDAERAISSLNAVRSLDDTNLAATLAKNPDFVKGLMMEVALLDDNIIEADEKEEMLHKLEDIIKLGNAASVYNAKFKEYLANPGQQVADHDRADQENAQAAQTEANTSLRQKLDKATSVAQFRQILNSEQDAVTRESVLQAMETEGSQVAKNYKETLQYDNELRLALSQLGETDQTTQDALSLWQEQFNAAENLEQLANPNSIFINNEDAFIEDSGGDVELTGTRFENARYALQRAMSKVNNDIKFKNRFSEAYRKPVDEPVQGKGTDKDETGDSGTTAVPHVNPGATPVETPSAPIGNVTPEMVAAENSDANRRVETQRTLDQSQQGQRRYYRPAVPELHIEASKEGDFRPFDVVVAEREPNVDFSGIYNYLRDNGAFSYVNAAKIKPGDTLGFMIDPDFNDHTIFLVDTRNNQIVGSIDESDASVARYEGLEEVIKKVRDEFSKRGEEATGKFFATPQTRVSKMMVGRVPYSTEDRSLADIPGVLDGNAEPVFGIIKNGVLTTNEKIDDRLIIKPVDMSQKEGRLYLLIPNAAGTYSPAAVRVKHFNTQEFNLDDATVANTPIGRGINEALDRLADATSQDDVSVAMKELAQDIYMQDVMVTWFDAKAGSGIVISRKVRKPDGTYEMVTINGQEQIKEEKTTIYFQSSKKSVTINGMEVDIEAAKEMGADLSLFGQPREVSEIRRDILNTILGFNLPIQVSASRINDSGYNNRVIKSNVLTSNLREAKVIGSWFTTDYFDNQGNLQRAVSPASVKPAPSRRVSSPVGGTEGVMQGTRVVISGTPYIVDLKSSIAMNEKTGEKRAFSAFNSQSLIDMAWAQETFGDATESSIMTENKIITPKGDVLDRNTGHYITGEEAQRIKDKIAGRNRETETQEKGIPITYNPAVNVPLASTVQAPKTGESLPIFDSTMETMITKPEEQNRVLPENAFEEGGEIGYYEKDGKLYTGYLKKIGEIEVTYGSGQKDMVPIYVTKVRDRGFGRAGEFGASSEYLTVFLNGKAISTRTNDTNDAHAAEVIMKALSAKPEKVLTLSNEKTQIYNPRMLEELEAEQRNRQYTPSTPTEQGGASRTVQRENAVNQKAAKRTRHKLRAADSTRPVWNRERELAWLEKTLPQLSEQDRVKIVEGLIQVAENGPVAWGMFSDGIVTLSDIAAEGTTYHEAFHVVYNLMLTAKERETLLAEARQLYGDKSELSLEEDMAEGFREYMALQESRGLGRKILDFFKNLFAKVTNWKYMKPSLNAYYRMIDQGKYAKISIPSMQQSRVQETSSFDTLSEELKQALQEKGWTQEHFDRISQEERDQAVECIGL